MVLIEWMSILRSIKMVKEAEKPTVAQFGSRSGGLGSLTVLSGTQIFRIHLVSDAVLTQCWNTLPELHAGKS